MSVRKSALKRVVTSRYAFAIGLIISALLTYVLTICFLIIFEMLSIAQRSYLFTPPKTSQAQPARPKSGVTGFVLPLLKAPLSGGLGFRKESFDLTREGNRAGLVRR